MVCFVCNEDVPDTGWLSNHAACDKCHKQYLLWLEKRYAKEVLQKQNEKKL